MDGGQWKMENVKWTMDNEQGRQQIIMNSWSSESHRKLAYEWPSREGSRPKVNSWSSESRATFAIEREHAKLA